MRYLFWLIRKTYRMARPREREVVMNNVAALSALQIITYALPLLIVPYLFRVVGPEKFGLIAFAQAFVQYFMILTDYGFSISATKEIALSRNEHAKITRAFSSVMLTKLALALASLLILCAVVRYIPRFRNDWLIYLFSFGTVVGNTLFPLWFFQGTEKMRYITNLNIIGGILYAFFILYFVREERDYPLVPFITSLVSLITGFLGQYIVWRRFRVSFKFEGFRNVRQQLKAGWDIFISTAAINAYTTTRIFILGLLTNNNVTGYYSIAEKIAGACQTFPLESFSRAIFPRLSAIFQRNRVKALEIMKRLQQITVLISLVCLPLIALCSPWIVKAACGQAYPETVTSLRILILSVFFVAANAFRVQFLLVCGKTAIYSRIHVVAAMVGLPLIFLLVYSFSYTGAAAATVMIETGIFAVTFFTVKKLRYHAHHSLHGKNKKGNA